MHRTIAHHPRKKRGDENRDGTQQRTRPLPSSYANAPSDGMCQVCTVVEFQFHHYGAFVCNRCRAFFRRMVRRIRNGSTNTNCDHTKLPYESSALPVCDITKFRGACPACRFATCINKGMKPAMVLTDADRMRTYHRKTNDSPKRRVKQPAKAVTKKINRKKKHQRLTSEYNVSSTEIPSVEVSKVITMIPSAGVVKPAASPEGMMLYHDLPTLRNVPAFTPMPVPRFQLPTSFSPCHKPVVYQEPKKEMPDQYPRILDPLSVFPNMMQEPPMTLMMSPEVVLKTESSDEADFYSETPVPQIEECDPPVFVSATDMNENPEVNMASPVCGGDVSDILDDNLSLDELDFDDLVIPGMENFLQGMDEDLSPLRDLSTPDIIHDLTWDESFPNIPYVS